MVGNDVVDLGDEEAREDSLHPGFDRRVFTSAELAILDASGHRHLLRWTLWAAKESAYKLAKRDDPGVVFAHRAFEVDLVDGCWGEVRHRDLYFSMRVHRFEDAVHVVCSRAGTPHEHVRAGVALKPSDRSPSEAVRDFTRRELSGDLGAEPHHIAIEKQGDRIPALRVHGDLTDASLSLSHHGRYVAYAVAWKAHHNCRPADQVLVTDRADSPGAR